MTDLVMVELNEDWHLSEMLDEEWRLYHTCTSGESSLCLRRGIPFEHYVRRCLLCQEHIPEEVLKSAYTIILMDKLA